MAAYRITRHFDLNTTILVIEERGCSTLIDSSNHSERFNNFKKAFTHAEALAQKEANETGKIVDLTWYDSDGKRHVRNIEPKHHPRPAR